MAKTLQLGATLVLPADGVTQTMAFIGRKGSGKTYAASKLAEEMLGIKAQVIVLDPIGNWYGLRLKADGKRKGFDIPLFGGLHGDLPLESTSGRLIADLIVDRQLSAIIDVSQFRKNQRKQFATAFAEQLFHRKKSNKTPLHLFIEEAQVFIPQRVQPGEQGMVGAFEDLVRLGRNYGIGCSLISQRPQSVHKEVLNQVEMLVVLQINGAHERKAIAAWVTYQGFEKGLTKELPSLPVGTAFVWSPQWLDIFKKVKIGRKQTYDASATPTVGSRSREPGKLTALDIKVLTKAMAEVVENVEKNDPTKLKKQIAQLEKELLKKGKIVTVTKPVFSEKQSREIFELSAKVATLQKTSGAIGDEIFELVRRATEQLEQIEPVLAKFDKLSLAVGKLSPAVKKAASAQGNGRPVLKLPSRPIPVPVPDGLTLAHQRVLNGLAWLEVFGIMSPGRRQLAWSVGQSPKSGYFNNIVSALRTSGLVDYPGSNLVKLTDSGRLSAAAPEGLENTNESFHQTVLAKLPSPQKKILRALIGNYPESFSRGELAAAVEQSAESGYFNNNISAMRTAGIVEYPNQGEVAASEILFPEG